MSILRHFVVSRFVLAVAFAELASVIISGLSVVAAEISVVGTRL